MPNTKALRERDYNYQTDQLQMRDVLVKTFQSDEKQLTKILKMPLTKERYREQMPDSIRSTIQENDATFDPYKERKMKDIKTPETTRVILEGPSNLLISKINV